MVPHAGESLHQGSDDTFGGDPKETSASQRASFGDVKIIVVERDAGPRPVIFTDGNDGRASVGLDSE